MCSLCFHLQIRFLDAPDNTEILQSCVVQIGCKRAPKLHQNIIQSSMHRVNFHAVFSEVKCSPPFDRINTEVNCITVNIAPKVDHVCERSCLVSGLVVLVAAVYYDSTLKRWLIQRTAEGPCQNTSLNVHRALSTQKKQDTLTVVGVVECCVLPFDGTTMSIINAIHWSHKPIDSVDTVVSEVSAFI